MKVMVNKFFIVNNFKILLYYIVRDRLCNSNPVKFYLWCPFCNIPCFLLQAVLDADWGKENQVFCAVLLHRTQIYQRFHSNHEIFIGDSDCWPPKPPAKCLSSWHWVAGVATRRTKVINSEASKLWKSDLGLSHRRHRKNLWCKNEEPEWEGSKESVLLFRQMLRLRSIKITLGVSLSVPLGEGKQQCCFLRRAECQVWACNLCILKIILIEAALILFFSFKNFSCATLLARNTKKKWPEGDTVNI